MKTKQQENKGKSVKKMNKKKMTIYEYLDKTVGTRYKEIDIDLSLRKREDGKVFALCFDSGGAKGVFSCRLAMEIELRLKKHTTSMF